MRQVEKEDGHCEVAKGVLHDDRKLSRAKERLNAGTSGIVAGK